MNKDNDKNGMEAIAQRIKKKRIDLGYSYQDFANLTKLSKSTLQRYETGGIANLPLDKIEIIANALDVSVAYLLGWSEEASLYETTLSSAENLLKTLERCPDSELKAFINRIINHCESIIDGYVSLNYFLSQGKVLDAYACRNQIYYALDGMTASISEINGSLSDEDLQLMNLMSKKFTQ